MNHQQREYVLCEFRCALVRAKLAQLDIEAAAVALKHNIVSPEQAVAMLWDTEAGHYLGMDGGLRNEAA